MLLYALKFFYEVDFYNINRDIISNLNIAERHCNINLECTLLCKAWCGKNKPILIKV